MSGKRCLRPRFAAVVPGILGPASRLTTEPRARSLTLPAPKGLDQREAGLQGFQTPQWSAVRRDRSSQDRCALRKSANEDMRRYGAPLPLVEGAKSRDGTGSLRRKIRPRDGRNVPVRPKARFPCLGGPRSLYSAPYHTRIMAFGPNNGLLRPSGGPLIRGAHRSAADQPEKINGAT